MNEVRLNHKHIDSTGYIPLTRVDMSGFETRRCLCLFFFFKYCGERELAPELPADEDVFRARYYTHLMKIALDETITPPGLNEIKKKREGNRRSLFFSVKVKYQESVLATFLTPPASSCVTDYS